MLIGLCGMAGAGKDSVADVLVREHGYVRLALADPLRAAALRLNPIVADGGLGLLRLSEVVEHMGWDAAKRSLPEVRRLLQVFGAEVIREMCGEDFWVDLALRSSRGQEDVVITDVRFHNEALAIHEAGGHIYRVVRPGVEPLPGGHASEAGIPDGLVTGEIWNSGSLLELEGMVNILFNHERFAA